MSGGVCFDTVPAFAGLPCCPLGVDQTLQFLERGQFFPTGADALRVALANAYLNWGTIIGEVRSTSDGVCSFAPKWTVGSGWEWRSAVGVT